MGEHLPELVVVDLDERGLHAVLPLLVTQRSSCLQDLHTHKHTNSHSSSSSNSSSNKTVSSATRQDVASVNRLPVVVSLLIVDRHSMML